MKKITFLLVMLLTAFSMDAQTSYGNVITGNGGTGGGSTSNYFGSQAGRLSTGTHNSFIGYRSGYDNTSGYQNTFLGSYAGYNNTTGHRNSFVGYGSGYFTTTGRYNTTMGAYSGYRNTTGRNNTYMGYRTGYNNSTGSGNVLLGYYAGYYATGSNKLFIDNSSTNSPLIYGDFSTNSLTFNGKVGVNGSIPTGGAIPTDIKLYVKGRFSQLVAGNLGGFASGDKWSSLGNSFIPGSSGSTIYGMFNQGFGAAFISGSKSGANNIVGFSGNRLDFDVISSSGPAQTKVSILNNGRMGVGTTTPTNTLHVNGSGRISNTWIGTYPNGGGYTDGVAGLYSLHLNAAKTSNVGGSIVFLSAGVQKMLMNTYGNLGVKRNPGSYYALDVNGPARVTSLYQSSDKRFKKDIKDIDNALDKLNELDGLTYKFKAEKIGEYDFTQLKGEKQLGFIAQDLRKVFPELVNEDEDGYLAVNYTGLIPVLVEGMKEQQEVITDQKAEIADLQTRMEKLEALLNTSSETIQGSLSVPTENTATGVVLRQNAPNPFSSSTTIEYQLPENVKTASLLVSDLNGRTIANYTISGQGTIEFSAQGLINGTYVYAILANGQSIASQKMVIQK